MICRVSGFLRRSFVFSFSIVFSPRLHCVADIFQFLSSFAATSTRLCSRLVEITGVVGACSSI
jgi:hypothetical protein